MSRGEWFVGCLWLSILASAASMFVFGPMVLPVPAALALVFYWYDGWEFKHR